ncbi:RNA-binding protein, putative [Plasmodium malariae]|uniref:RNA-binding protein, putative n=1 Tax=Plasmodium malariae TaxID=5858 RepID=A0A1C3K9T5_PLAMA|nr:RNA-binding protein, putative [Plasmodium malariae]
MEEEEEEVNHMMPLHFNTKKNHKNDITNIGKKACEDIKENLTSDIKVIGQYHLEEMNMVDGNYITENTRKLNTENKNEEKDEWMIYVSNNSYGPYNLEQVIKLWNEKRINIMTTIFKKGENNWKFVYNDEILKKHLLHKDVNDNYSNVRTKDISNKHVSWEHSLNRTCHIDSNDQTLDYNKGKGGENKSINDNGNDKLHEQNEENEIDLEKLRKREKKKKYLERKKKKIEEGLCDKKVKNNSIYITGLPKDVTKEEINNVFKKAGIIKIDAESTEPKIKIYYDENNNVKGDALVTYVYTQSVDIAIKYFDNFYFRQDCLIHVEKAQFSKKKEPVKVSKEEILIKKKKIKAAKYEQLRLQKWGEVYMGTKKKIVIFRNVFSYEDAVKYDEGDPFYDFIKNLIEMEVKKYVPVYKVYPIPKHPNGIVCVKFKEVEEAEMIVSCFRDIELNDKKLEVYFYDGKQDLKAQCLSSKNCPKVHTENLSEINTQEKNIDDNNPPFLIKNNLQSFHEWIDNQSEDEEHEIKVE